MMTVDDDQSFIMLDSLKREIVNIIIYN